MLELEVNALLLFWWYISRPIWFVILDNIDRHVKVVGCPRQRFLSQVHMHGSQPRLSWMDLHVVSW